MPYQYHSNSQPRPRNRTAVSPAIRALQRLTPAINEQQNNALLVNGYEVLVYNRLRTGVHCSCGGGTPGAGGGAVLNSDGEASQETLQELLRGGTFGYDSYGNDSSSHTPQEGISHARQHSNYNDERLHARKETEFSNAGYENATGLDDGSEQPEFPLNPFSEGHLISCPICFGTGFNGGYSVCNSWRFVASAVLPLGLELATINTDVRPYAIDLIQTDSYMSFEARVPAGALSVDSMRVFSGLQQLGPEVSLDYYDDDSEAWVALTPQTLLQRANGGVTLFRVVALQPGVRVTHVELQLGLSDVALLVDFPRLVETADTSVLLALQDVSLECSSWIPQLRAFDIMTDINNRHQWMMREVERWDNNARATGKTNYGWRAQARVIQANEIWSLLPVRRASVADSRHRAATFGQQLRAGRATMR